MSSLRPKAAARSTRVFDPAIFAGLPVNFCRVEG